LTELDTDEVLISDYEVDAIVAKVVNRLSNQIRCTALLIITHITVSTAIIMYILLG